MNCLDGVSIDEPAWSNSAEACNHSKIEQIKKMDLTEEQKTEWIYQIRQSGRC